MARSLTQGFLLLSIATLLALIVAVAPAKAEHNAAHVQQMQAGCPQNYDPIVCPAPGEGGVPLGTQPGDSYTPTGAAAPAPSQDDGGSITARGADTAPVNANGTCPSGFVRTNAPGNLACAEESPNTPGRIFGYGEGDLATQEAAAPQAPQQQSGEGTTASATQYADDEAIAELPDTGGPSVLLLGGGLALVLGGLLLYKRLS